MNGAYLVALCDGYGDAAVDELVEYISQNTGDASKPLWHASVQVSRTLRNNKPSGMRACLDILALTDACSCPQHEIRPHRQNKRIKFMVLIDGVSTEAVADLLNFESVCEVMEDGMASVDEYNWGKDRVDQANLPLVDSFVASCTGLNVDV